MTVPYRVFYNAWQALKCAVGRGALTTPQPCPAAHYKICDNPHTGPCRIFCIIIHHKLPYGHPPTKYKKSPARQAVTMARPCRGFLDFILCLCACACAWLNPAQNSAPNVAAITALMVCIRFSASWNTMDCGPVNTSSVTSMASRPNFSPISLPTAVLWS